MKDYKRFIESNSDKNLLLGELLNYFNDAPDHIMSHIRNRTEEVLPGVYDKAVKRVDEIFKFFENVNYELILELLDDFLLDYDEESYSMLCIHVEGVEYNRYNTTYYFDPNKRNSYIIKVIYRVIHDIDLSSMEVIDGFVPGIYLEIKGLLDLKEIEAGLDEMVPIIKRISSNSEFQWDWSREYEGSTRPDNVHGYSFKIIFNI
jgi:hypothetical protein